MKESSCESFVSRLNCRVTYESQSRRTHPQPRVRCINGERIATPKNRQPVTQIGGGSRRVVSQSAGSPDFSLAHETPLLTPVLNVTNRTGAWPVIISRNLFSRGTGVLLTARYRLARAKPRMENGERPQLPAIHYHPLNRQQ